MLSTTEVSLIEIIVLTAVCVVALAQVALITYVARKSVRDFPLKTDINRLAGEVSDLSGENAALRERFSRFQKREDLAGARAAKKSQAELQAEALALVQGGGETSTSSSPKAELYKRARGH